jgi:radical SAM superfamily enzyme YgiQ (UPF0313 family)
MKPRILLVNPPVYDFTAHDFWLKPYGLIEVAGCLRGRADFRLFDYMDRSRMRPLTKSDVWGRGKYQSEVTNKPSAFRQVRRRFKRFGLPRDEFLKFLDKNGPFDFALVQTVMTYWYPGVKEVIDDIRKAYPSVRIVLGGVYATLCGTHAQALGADLVVQGTDISPLWKFIGVEPDTTQTPLWECYGDTVTGVMKLSDGCPFACTYCSVSKVYPKFAPRPLEKCLRELELLKRTRVSNIAFYDDALLFQPEGTLIPFLESCAGMKEDIGFHTPNAVNARLLTPELARLMVRAGFKTFYLGFESMSSEWQKRTGGKVCQEDLARAVENLLSAGTKPGMIFAYIIAGHPDNVIQQVEESMRFAHGLGIRMMLAEYSPVPGTPDGEKCRNMINMDEPLMHNKTAFAISFLGESGIERLKTLCRELNTESSL